MFHRHSLITLIRQLKEESHIILVLQMLKLRLREVSLFVQGHTEDGKMSAAGVGRRP